MLRLLVLLFITACSINSQAQAINGFWSGRLTMEPGGCFPVYNIEFQLQVLNGTRITGNSYHYSDTSNFVKEEFEGFYDTSSKTITIQEMKVEVFRIPPDCTPCIKKYTLTFHTDGREEQLRGEWSGQMMDARASCPSGSIVLTRIQKSAFQPDLPQELIGRKNELVKEIFVDTGWVKLDFYDNGQIDGDTISVYLDNVALVSQKMLTTKPVSVALRIDVDKPQQEIIMVGLNLGSIPPNTALMIVHAGDKRYQLYLTADEKKNSMVRFIYKPPDDQPPL